MSRTTGVALPNGEAWKQTTDLNNNLVDLFECPVCLNYALPPILQCQSGHLVCSACRTRLTHCPTCRIPLLGNIRNLAMEKVAALVLFPCEYASWGCEVALPHADKAEHEELCALRPCSCPCPGVSCKWQGSLEAVVPHLLHKHRSILTLQGEDIVFLATDTNCPHAIDWMMMQSCFGFHFTLALKKRDMYDGQQLFFATVQLIGTRQQAERFTYRLQLSGHQRCLAWEAAPRSILESTAVVNRDCLVFDASTAQLFAENGDLSIDVTICTC